MELGAIVFKYESHKRKQCYIYECTDRYELHVDNIVAAFDKSEKSLAAIVNAFRDYGAPVSFRKRNIGFGFRKTDKQYRLECVIPMSHILLSSYNNTPLTSYRGKRVSYVDGDAFNLRQSNLSLTQTILVDIVSLYGKKYTRIKCKENTSAVAITNYDETLHGLISSLSWHYWRKDKVFRTTASNNKKRFLHQLVWVYYKYGATESDWAKKIDDMYNNNVGFVIDHKKCWNQVGKFDNRIENLQLIPQSNNFLKSNVTAKMNGDMFYIPTCNGAVYGKFTDGQSSVTYCRLCGDLEKEDIKNIWAFYRTGKFSNGVDHKELARDDSEMLDIVLSNIHETKLYMEAYSL